MLDRIGLEEGALEQSVIEVCKVVSLKERPVARVDYSKKLCPVWSHHGTGSDRIMGPRQLAIICC